MKILDVLEKQIASLSEMAIVVDQTEHGEDRRYRHTETISYDDITTTINKALPEIAQMIIDRELEEKDTLVIYNSHNNLNVVGAINLNENIFKVITTMIKQNFIPKKGDKKISV